MQKVEPETISRVSLIVALRNELAERAKGEMSICKLAAEKGIFCRGFRRYSDADLKQRYGWIAKRYPNASRAELEAMADGRARLDRLCELNVLRQVKNVASDVFVHEAWARGQSLHVHGWIYSLANGLVTDLNVTVSPPGN